MELSKEDRKSITDAQKISDIIGEKLKDTKEDAKEGVDLVGLAKGLAKRRVDNLKK